MAVPKRRKSHSRARTARAHKGMKPAQVNYCPQCNAAFIMHAVCPNCGHYRKREVIPMEKT